MSSFPKISLSRIEVLFLNLPLVHLFNTGFGSIEKKSTIIIKIYTPDGYIGWGEAATLPFPFYKADATDKIAYLVLTEYILPKILGVTIYHPSEIISFYDSIRGNNFAKTAVETACWMIYSEQINKPLSTILNGKYNKIAIGESIGIKKTINQTLDEISLRLSEGYKRIKIKIKPNWDIKVIEAVRNKYGNIDLMVDGNSSYTLKDISLLQTLDNYNLLMIEQPLSENDIVDHAALQKSIKTPICLDESICSFDDAEKAIKIGACKIINIKPGRVGGLTVSKQIHDLCQKNSIGVWCGGMMETGIGRAYNIALSSLPNFIYPADMSPSNIFYSTDLINPSYNINSNGYITVPKSPGLGYQVDEKQIKKYTRHSQIFKSNV